MVNAAMFEPYLDRWRLLPDGEPIVTRGSKLLPVRWGGLPAMLKIASDAEERIGGAVMEWWAGRGAARVYARDGEALLMERAEGPGSLLAMAENGRDDEASRIACAIADALHAPRAAPPEGLASLEQWFAALWPAAATHGGLFAQSAAVARQLLAAQAEVTVLHGDIHHLNILDFGPRGWLAIDPKRVIGDRGYDYANLFCNPDLSTAVEPERFQRQLVVVGEAARIDRRRLLRWILAYAGLSAAWFLEDGEGAETDFAVGAMAAAELGLA